MERTSLPSDTEGDEPARSQRSGVPPGELRSGVSAELCSGVSAELCSIIEEILRQEEFGPLELDRILRRHPKDGRGFYSKREILEAFRSETSRYAVSEAVFAEQLRTCPTRSLSGIVPVTVLTKPFPCPGRCIFCPSDVRMPKSYLASEPGCQRAAANRFDPYRQTWSRLAAYRRMGHPTDKVELIVLGGTWSHYPETYQRWFMARCLDALNDFGAGVDRRPEVRRFTRDFSSTEATGRYHQATGSYSQATGSYNQRVGAGLRTHHRGTLTSDWERAGWNDLEASQRRNEGSGSRCVGLSVETRPDEVDPSEVIRLRRLGVTKVQLGLQSLSDDVLRLNRRGHDVADARRALARLRGAGFKLHAHWMPNLLGSNPAADRRDFARLFEDPAIRPDELKIYPCSLIETAELMESAASGAWRPYDHEELVELLADCLEQVPHWCRVTRVIRDIPSPEIVSGNRFTNLREVVEARLAARGVPLREIRAREIRGEKIEAAGLRLRETPYRVDGGREQFLEWLGPGDRIAGFLRLRLPEAGTAASVMEELAGSAVIREVHVYGAAAKLGERAPGQAQHAGLGRRLVARAAELARQAGHRNLAVISAVGTRDWYRRLGFRDGALYQHRTLPG